MILIYKVLWFVQIDNTPKWVASTQNFSLYIELDKKNLL